MKQRHTKGISHKAHVQLDGSPLLNNTYKTKYSLSVCEFAELPYFFVIFFLIAELKYVLSAESCALAKEPHT